MPIAPPTISFEHVFVRRGLKRVLHDISFKIHRKENVTILGPNGSGKSTLIKTITRELYPASGKVRMFGKETWDVFELRSQIGIVSYDIQALFNQEISGRDAVLSGFFSSVGLWKNNHVTPAMIQVAERAMKWIGVERLQNRTLTHLSSGEVRRFLIARALIHRPKLIVFDEPLNSLDLQAQGLIKTTLRKLVRSGVGLVLVTHQLSDIIPEMKRVILLKHGRISADGKKKDMLTSDRLSDLFETRLSVVENKGYFHALA